MRLPKQKAQSEKSLFIHIYIYYFFPFCLIIHIAINVDPDPTSRTVTTEKLTQYQDRKVQLKREILKAGLPLPTPARPLPDVAGGGGGTMDMSAASSSTGQMMGMGTLRGMPSTSQSAAPIAPAASSSSSSGGDSQRLLVKSTTGVIYFIGNKLGGGNFGVVHDCKDGFERDFVAKQIRPNRKKEELEAEWAKEVQFLFSLNHPNIVRLFDAFQYDDRYYMIMERCAGSVRDFVKRNGPMDGPRVIDAAGQILSGLNHIHCFDALDHQILTNRGFMFADELLAAVRWTLDGERVRVVDWCGLTVASYDEKARALVYKQPRALALNRGLQELIEFGDDDDDDELGLVATSNHDMYVRCGARGTFEKIAAGRVAVTAASQQVEFLAGAVNGVVASKTTTSRGERTAFLESYGRSLASGDEPDAVVAPWVSALSRAELRSVAHGLLLASGVDAHETDACGDRTLARGCVSVGGNVTLRDQLVEMLLRAGYSATFAAQGRLQWQVLFGECDTVDARVAVRATSPTRQQCTTWCFDMASSDERNDGFVVVRRARRVAAKDYAALAAASSGAAYEAALRAAVASAEASVARRLSALDATPCDWVVVAASRATVQGNSRDIIHRDLHIDNVLYAESLPGQNVNIKISDFGISKLLKNGQAAAKTFIGRDYDYAPELVTKGHTTTRSDLYQCGLVLFHLYTGRHVLSAKDGDNVVQVITSGLAGQRAKALNTKLGDVLAVLLRREPDYRFADASEAWQAIYSIVNPQRNQ